MGGIAAPIRLPNFDILPIKDIALTVPTAGTISDIVDATDTPFPAHHPESPGLNSPGSAWNIGVSSLVNSLIPLPISDNQLPNSSLLPFRLLA